MSGNIEDFRILLLNSRPVQASRRLSLQINSSDNKAREDGTLVRKCKSLPCSVDFYARVAVKSSNAHERKKVFSNRPKILRKTWDRVKGIIINSPSSSSGSGVATAAGASPVTRGNSSSDVVGKRGNCSSSAPSTPLRNETFFGDSGGGGGGDERDRIARNYALLQKRLSQEFRQSSLKKSSGTGEFSDEFKRKLFEWESHPSRRNKGNKECASGLSSRHLKELAWLDKQLEKIEAEKRRLEDELKKQVEREIRVQKMKEAIRCSVNERVYNIRTENGVKIRVEGITSEYAMKVYEWEEKRGIGVEMSALGYFDQKYRDDGDEKTHEEQGAAETKVTTEEEAQDDEVIIGPLDLINERLKKLEESEGQQGLGERGEQLLAECVALGEVASGACSTAGGGSGIGGEVDGRVSSTASSCCCSAEYEYEHTDSFATKNNSGASNTDSEVYEKRCTITRRRSSECVSTPDRGSPGLSAFTSEDEEVVKEDEEKKPQEEEGEDQDKAREVVVPLCVVKQIVIDEDNPSPGDSNVFVQTKRTIFSPVVEVNASAACDAGGGARIVGVIPKRPTYKPQPKTQLHRVFPPLACPPYCSPMASRKFNNGGGGGGGAAGGSTGTEFSIDRFLSDRGIGRKLPPRTNVHLARKYTIGGGFPPPLGRGCLIARSSSFNAHEDVCGGGGVDDDVGVRVVGFSENRDGPFVGVSKSKSTGSIKRSIANVKCFLGFKKGDQQQQQLRGGGAGGSSSGGGSTTGIGECSSQQGEQQFFTERRGSKSGGGFVRRLGAALWRGGNNSKDQQQQQQNGGGGGSGGCAE